MSLPYDFLNNLSDYINVPNGILMLDSNGNISLPNASFTLKSLAIQTTDDDSGSDDTTFVNDGTLALNVASIKSDSGKITTDGFGNLTVAGKISVTGTTSLDGGAITTDGSGAMYVATPTTTDNTTRVPTTAYVQSNLANYILSSKIGADSGVAALDASGGLELNGSTVFGYNSSTSTLTINPTAIVFSGSLPTTDPKVAGQWWNNGGTVYISAGS